MADWIIVERSKEEQEQDGIRWKAFPCHGLSLEKIKDIAYDPDVDRSFRWVNEI